MAGAYLGPSFSQEQIEARLSAMGAKFETISTVDMIDTTASAIADGEFGPRAGLAKPTAA
jgi:carbamoyltransferase